MELAILPVLSCEVGRGASLQPVAGGGHIKKKTWTVTPPGNTYNSQKLRNQPEPGLGYGKMYYQLTKIDNHLSDPKGSMSLYWGPMNDLFCLHDRKKQFNNWTCITLFYMVRQFCMLYSSLCGRLTVALLEMRASDKTYAVYCFSPIAKSTAAD